VPNRSGSFDEQPAREGRHRVGVAAELPRLLTERGIAPDRVLAAAELPLDVLRNPENAVSFPMLCRLLAIAAEMTDEPHIAALVGRRGSTASLGLVGRLMQTAPTLGDAILDLCRNQHRYISGAVTYLIVQGDTALWGYTLEQPHIDGATLVCEGAIGIACSIVEELAGIRPEEALLARRPPAETSHYEDAFGVRARFSTELFGVVMRKDHLRLPVRSCDRDLRAILQQQVAAYWAQDRPGVADQVRRSLAARITAGSATAIMVAADLAISVRTMNRRLESEGATFRDLVAEARYNASRHLIRTTDMPLTDISLALGYTSQGAFTRAFTRWAGCAPMAWRALAS
jgi:AraC-like DNA-binding protein